MTKERFLIFIQQPYNIQTNDIEELEQIIEQFPYFQTARLIYTKSLHNENSYLYNDELKRTAAFAADKAFFTNSSTPSIKTHILLTQMV